MKAVRVSKFGGPEALVVQDVPDPTPGPGEVRVRLHAAGVNPVDAYVRGGNYALVKPTLPYTPGMEGAGVVEKLGEGVVDIAVGERVWVSETIAGRLQGAYAEKCVSPAARVHALPDALSFEQGAAINIAYVTAYRAIVDRGHTRPGETVLVHGATGGVGLAAVQIASRLGAIVLGTGGTDAGRRLAAEHGATKTFDHKADGYLDDVKIATGGRGVDVIIEMLADQNLGNDLPLLAPRGRVVIVGSRGPVQIDARNLMGAESDVRGMTYFGGGDAAVLNAVAAVQAQLAAGAYVPHVGKAFALADAAAAHEAVMSGGGATGKIVLTM